MAFRTIRHHSDGILRKTSKPVKEIDNKIITLLDDMRDTVVQHNGLGLSAPQVGVLKRIVVVDIRNVETDSKNLPDERYYELINPEIIEIEGEQIGSEGCLSLPGKSGKVRRPGRVVVRAQNRSGEEYTVEGKGILAVAMCHELDHLDGILYIDKIEPGTFEDESDYDDDYDDDYDEE